MSATTGIRDDLVEIAVDGCGDPVTMALAPIGPAATQWYPDDRVLLVNIHLPLPEQIAAVGRWAYRLGGSGESGHRLVTAVDDVGRSEAHSGPSRIRR